MFILRGAILFYFILFLVANFCLAKERVSSKANANKGAEFFFLAEEHFEEGDYWTASELFWKAILFPTNGYTVEEAMKLFFKCYALRGIPDQGVLYVAKRLLERGEVTNALGYFEQAVQMNTSNVEAHLLYADALDAKTSASGFKQKDDVEKRLYLLNRVLELSPSNAKAHYELGQHAFNTRQWKTSLQHMTKASYLDNSRKDAEAAAIYLRSFLADWGEGGKQYAKDMREIESIVAFERVTRMQKHDSTEQQSVIHPHMTLSYDVSSECKLHVAMSHARAEKVYAIAMGGIVQDKKKMLLKYQQEATGTLYYTRTGHGGNYLRYRVRVGYVCASIKSKAIMYLVQDLLRFHDRTKFEVHVFATSPPDSPEYIRTAMRGVDWRKKVKESVEYFHDVSHLDFSNLAVKIERIGLHILVDWDGYAHNGIRKLGLFALQPAPIQIAAQEFIGTMGADYIQYIIADPYSLPLYHAEGAYTEKLIHLPSVFFINSMAYIKELAPPELIKSSSPSMFGCGGAPASFVFCNFNKHLKFNPEVFSTWLHLLVSIDGSVLCLLENPVDAVENLRNFIDSMNRTELLDRVRFLPFIENPFDNQIRVGDSCDLIVDAPIYNSHTTAVDALWAGVPIVAFGNSKHFSGRVCASMLNTLGLPELIAQSYDQYYTIARNMASDRGFYKMIRDRLVRSCLEGNIFWDLEKYMKNLEKAYSFIWQQYLNGKPLDHVDVGSLGEFVPLDVPYNDYEIESMESEYFGDKDDSVLADVSSNLVNNNVRDRLNKRGRRRREKAEAENKLSSSRRRQRRRKYRRVEVVDVDDDDDEDDYYTDYEEEETVVEDADDNKFYDSEEFEVGDNDDDDDDVDDSSYVLIRRSKLSRRQRRALQRRRKQRNEALYGSETISNKHRRKRTIYEEYDGFSNDL